MKHFSRAAIVIAVGTAWPAMAGYAAPNASTIAALLKCFIVHSSTLVCVRYGD
jgi:hypothetical protein